MWRKELTLGVLVGSDLRTTLSLWKIQKFSLAGLVWKLPCWCADNQEEGLHFHLFDGNLLRVLDGDIKAEILEYNFQEGNV